MNIICAISRELCAVIRAKSWIVAEFADNLFLAISKIKYGGDCAS